MNTENLPSTWQEALENHSVADARAFEKQLRASTVRDKEKLRALVGSNYRDFLATAEQIVELTDQTRNAESDISALSQACKPPSPADVSQSAYLYANVASQLKLLDQMMRSASKASKYKMVLLASRLVVVSRLLLKHLEQYQDALHAAKWLQTRLKAVRRHLMKCIDSMLVNPATSLRGLSQAIVAHCLTTSSSSIDGVKHFQMLRKHRLAQSEADSSSKSKSHTRIKQKCYYLLASVEAMKALSGRFVTELLNNLQKQPLLEDETLLRMSSLQMDMHRDLLPADILSFTPYFKRVVLTSSEVQETVQAWVIDAVKHIVQDIEGYIGNRKIASVLKLRREVLEILIPSYFSTFGHNSSAFDNVRTEFSKRVIHLLREQARELQSIADNLQNDGLATKEELLWKSEAMRQSSTEPAHRHLHALQRLHLGTQKSLQTYFRLLRKWAMVCTRIREGLIDLGRIRWQDRIEEYDDDDEEAAQQIIAALSKQDPQKFITKFDQDLLSTAEQFVTTISERTSDVVANKETVRPTHQIANWLRIIREVQTTLHSLVPSYQFGRLANSTLQLQEALAKHTASEFFDLVEDKEPQESLIFVAEDLPSPLTVSILQTLVNLMSSNGSIDLWTKPAVQKLRTLVLQRTESAEMSKFYACSDLDKKYFAMALRDNTAENKTSTDPVTRKAAMYWSRTKTLFGVLSV